MNIVVIGGSGAIGSALTNNLSKLYNNAIIHSFSSKVQKTLLSNVYTYQIAYDDEDSIEKSANIFSNKELDLVIVSTGFLHSTEVMPEKSLKDLSSNKFHYLFQKNTILPAILAKHFVPKLNKNKRSIFAALSARVGSISDNKLGGWYSYRSSKAALNMIIKCLAIEISRINKYPIIVGLHPGTVDSNLSKPYQGNLKKHQLFTPDFSAKKLIKVIQSLNQNDSGRCFAWDQKEISP